MRNAYGQLAGQNSLIIDTRITPSGLKTVLDAETKCLNHLLQFISKKSLANGTTEIYPSKKELKELKEEGIEAQVIPWVEDKSN